MNSLKYMCCLCLSISNEPFSDLQLKCQDNLSYFQKISVSLSQLASIMNQTISNYMLCIKCCETIEMIYKFNQSCLQNIKIYLSHKDIFEVDINSKQCYLMSGSNKAGLIFVNAETQTCLNPPLSNGVKDSKVTEKKDVEDFSNLMDMCEVNMEIEDANRNIVENQEENLNVKDIKISLTESKLDKEDKKEDYNNLNIILKKKEYACDVCKKTFKQKYNFKRHIQNHLIEKQYACNVCTKTFGRKDVLERHKLIHFEEKQYICDVCNKSFRQKAGLFQHKLTHSEERPYACDECDKQFKGKYELIKHKRVHTGEEPYVCELCGKGFKQLANLTDHRRKHTGEKPHVCKMCNESFKYKYQLVQHNNKIHSVQTLNSSYVNISP